MTADIQGQDHHKQDNATHARDYAGFVTLLKWATVVTAIISAIVIYVISN